LERLWDEKTFEAFEKTDCVKMSIFLLNKTDVFSFNSLCFLFLSLEKAGEPTPRKISAKGMQFVALPYVDSF